MCLHFFRDGFNNNEITNKIINDNNYYDKKKDLDLKGNYTENESLNNLEYIEANSNIFENYVVTNQDIHGLENTLYENFILNESLIDDLKENTNILNDKYSNNSSLSKNIELMNHKNNLNNIDLENKIQSINFQMIQEQSPSEIILTNLPNNSEQANLWRRELEQRLIDNQNVESNINNDINELNHHYNDNNDTLCKENQ